MAFNPSSIEHINAYLSFIENNAWPKDFEKTFNPLGNKSISEWLPHAMLDMSDLWLNKVKNEEIILQDTPINEKAKLFSEWFNPENSDHFNAFVSLEENDWWPERFIPETVEMDYLWQYALYSKTSELWIKHMIECHSHPH